MSAQHAPDGSVTRGGSSVRRRAGRLLAWGVGIGLIVLAVWAATRAGGALAAAWDHFLKAPPGGLAVLGLLVALTPVLTAMGFHVLTGRYGQVGRLEMVWLICGAWLLNFLPLSPGMFGRIAYHRTVNSIPVRGSAMTIIWANILSVVAGGVLLVAAGVSSLFFRGDDWRFALLSAAPLAIILPISWHARRARPKPDPEVWRVVAALAVRYVELHVWTARVWLVFGLVGTPVSWGGALALAAVGTLASLFPLAPNGLGAREWAIGFVAPLLPVGMAYTAGLTTGAGLSAELLHRACELVVAVPLGLVGLGIVAARLRGVAGGSVSQ